MAKFCSECGKELSLRDSFVFEGNPVCRDCLRKLRHGRLVDTANTSGQGPSAPVPTEIEKWNWGAFFLGWIWGLGNKAYVAFLTLIPGLNIFVAFFLGAKGSKLAWQNTRWNSIQHFQKIQKRWAWVGIGLVAIAVFAGIVGAISERPPGTKESAQQIRQLFPNISQESAEKFVNKVTNLELTDEEALTWAIQLAVKGEVFLSDSEKEEMASLWWKAVGELPPEQQTFIQSAVAKTTWGEELTLEEQELISTYLEHGFTLVNQADKDRYLHLRTKALEEALQRE